MPWEYVREITGKPLAQDRLSDAIAPIFATFNAKIGSAFHLRWGPSASGPHRAIDSWQVVRVEAATFVIRQAVARGGQGQTLIGARRSIGFSMIGRLMMAEMTPSATDSHQITL